MAQASCQQVSARRIGLRYANLSESNWCYADLTGACLVGVDATGARFSEAQLDHADLSAATLRSSTFSTASCLSSTFVGSDLHQANLSYASLDFADLDGAHLEGADLIGCSATLAHFGLTWQINAETRIDNNNHALIGMALLSEARTVEQQQFALYVRYQHSLCWFGFLRLLLRQSDSVATWAKEVLLAIESLRTKTEHYAEAWERQRWERRASLDLDGIPPQLQALLFSEIEQQQTLTNLQLYWYLSGVLAIASQQPEMRLDESQKQAALAQLRRFTQMEE